MRALSNYKAAPATSEKLKVAITLGLFRDSADASASAWNGMRRRLRPVGEQMS